MHRFLVALLLVGTPLAASAEPLRYDGQLTLQQAVARVQTAGFEVEFAGADALAARARGAMARGGLIPQIGVTATTLNSHLPQLGMPVARQTYLSVIATVPIIVPSALFAVRGAGLVELGASAQIDEARNDAAYTVIQLYHRAQLAQALIDARTASATTQQSHLHQTELRVAAGNAARYVLSRDRAAAAVAQQGLQDAIADRDERLNDLKAALNYRIDSNIVLAQRLQVNGSNLSQAEAMRRAVVQRPSVIAALRQIQAARLRTSAAKAQYFPSITGNAQTYSGSSSPALGTSGYQFGLTASLPIIDANRSAAILQAKSDEQRAQTQYDQTALIAQRDVANSYSELNAATLNLQTAHAALLDAQEQLRIARLREAAGKGINLEILDAFSADANAEESVLVAIARYDNAIAAIEHATGDLASTKENLP